MDSLLSRGFWSKHGISVSEYRLKLKKRLSSEKKSFDKYFALIPSQIISLNRYLGIESESSKNFVLLFCLSDFFERHRNAIRILFKSDNNATLFLKLAKILKTKKKNAIFDSIKYYDEWTKRGSDRYYKIVNFDPKLITKLSKHNKGLLRKMPAGKNRDLFVYKKLFSNYFGDYYIHIVSKKALGKKTFEPIKGFAININTGRIELTADVDIEFNAILKALEKKEIYVDRVNLTGKSSANLLNWIAGNTPISGFDLIETTFNETELGNAVKLKVSSKQGKTDISSEIQQLAQRGILKLTDVRQISDFGFYHNKTKSWIWIFSGYGAYQLKLFNRKTSVQKRQTIELDFENALKISLNEFIESEFAEDEKKELIKHFLESSLKKKSQNRDKLSKYAEKTYISLVELGILKKPIKKELKKTCTTRGCNYYQKPLWGLKTCPVDGCQKPLLITGTDFIFDKDLAGINKFIINKANEQGYSAVSIERKIKNKAYNFIELVDKNKTSLLIYLSPGKKIDKKLLTKLEMRCPKLFAIHFEFPIKATELQEHNFYNINLLDFIWNYSFTDNQHKKDLFSEAITNQNANWKTKIIAQSTKAKNNLLSPPQDYDYENFEFDCFSLINRMSNNAVWLGSKKRGVSIPDGAAHFKSISGMCFAWDCKYSGGTAKRRFDGKTEGPDKFSKYISDLRQNATIRALGGLKGFIIIANNPNEKNFKKVFQEVKKKSRGVNITLLTKDALLSLFEEYLQNESVMNSSPNGIEKFNEWLLKNIFKKSKLRIVTKESLAKNKFKLQLNPLPLTSIEDLPSSPPVS
ncbi:MAG: hypothetical protein WCW44_00095 [archaeon]|jgi:hypothetical protein